MSRSLRYRWRSRIVSGEPKLSLRAIAVAAALWEHFNPAGECWPGLGRLAEQLSVARPETVSAGIRELERKGLLEVIRNGGPARGPNGYRTNLYRLKWPATPPQMRGGSRPQKSSATPPHLGGGHTPTNGGTSPWMGGLTEKALTPDRPTERSDNVKSVDGVKDGAGRRKRKKGS